MRILHLHYFNYYYFGSVFSVLPSSIDLWREPAIQLPGGLFATDLRGPLV